MKFYFLIFISILAGNAFSQLDTSSTLHQDEFLLMVVQNHPLVKKAELISKKGELNVKTARGGFDPYLYNYFSQKQFEGKEYYNLLNSGLKIPTWYGIEGKVAYENTSGYYLNPEHNTPTNGLVTAGVSVAVGKGLFIDERRKTLQKAKIYDDLSDLEQFLEINTILFSATKAFWDWVIAYNHVKVYGNAVVLANIRLEGVKKNFYQGAEPAIDTLEANIQLQNRILSFNKAKLELKQTSLNLSNYLWTENLEPLELTDKVTAPEILDEFHNYIKSESDITAYNNFNVENHPYFKAYELKLNSLDIEKRYASEGLKPKLNVNYNFLTKPTNDSPISQLSTNNYKLGLEFSMPLFLREQRGKFQVSKIKIEETKYDQAQKIREINNKVEYYYQEIKTLEIQEKISTRNTVNYETLLDAEKRKFDLGESSLFLINSRETKVIASQIKLIDLRGKYQKSHASLTNSMGLNIVE